MEEGGLEVGVGDLLDAKEVEGLEIHLVLGKLELGDGLLAVVDGEELDQLLEVLDLLVGDLDGRLQIQDLALLLRLRLEERLHGGLAALHFLQLLRVVLLLLLGVELRLHDALAALQTVVHALDVEELTLEPEVGVSVGVLGLLLVLLDAVLQVLALGVGEHALVVVLVGVVGQAHVLVLHERVDQLDLVDVVLGASLHHLLHVLLLELHDPDGLLEEVLKDHDALVVGVHRLRVLLLVDLEVQAVLLKHLDGRLLGQGLQHLVNLALAPREDLELLGEDDVVVFGDFLHEPLE
mmetsp:Transcript_2687/g.4524  ORF Transcript_2687/g.4524 Transcript_2687/m.4524 type:complete len:294 (-) Transcript_2687:834-1715(-)